MDQYVQIIIMIMLAQHATILAGIGQAWTMLYNNSEKEDHCSMNQAAACLMAKPTAVAIRRGSAAMRILCEQMSAWPQHTSGKSCARNVKADVPTAVLWPLQNVLLLYPVPVLGVAASTADMRSS